MKKIKILCIATIILMLTLSSCTSKARRAEEKMTEIRAEMLEADRVTATAEIRADYGERVFDFRIKFDGTAALGEIEIKKPSNLEGITATVSAGGATIRYDGAALDTGDLGERISPATAIQTLISEWESGFVDSAVLEKLDSERVLAMTSRVEDAVQKTWFDMDTNLPIKSEISIDGYTILTLEFDSISLR